jgi:hypothetical protein
MAQTVYRTESAQNRAGDQKMNWEKRAAAEETRVRIPVSKTPTALSRMDAERDVDSVDPCK